MSAPVVIVGGGPVGLVTMLRLRTLGVDATLFEAEEGVTEDLRASTFHPPTLDMLETMGLAGPLVAEGLVSPTWQVRIHETHEKAEFDLSVLAGETGHPFRLQCEQYRLSRLALAALRAEGADIRFGMRVESVRDDGDGAVVRWRRGEETGEVRASWVVGADGARSVVRAAIDPDFGGLTYPETTILATTTRRFEDALPGLSNVNYVWWTGGTFSLLRLRRIWRCSLYPDAGESVEAALLPDAVERKLQRIAPQAERYAVEDVRPYRMHMRIARAFRRGRIVLAGDAAHLNSPSGGMGLNGGLHDAFMLTDALRAALDSGRDDALDRYARVRRAVAEEDVLRQADRNRARMQETDPSRRRSLFKELKRTAETPALARDHLLRTSMIAGLRRAQAAP